MHRNGKLLVFGFEWLVAEAERVEQGYRCVVVIRWSGWTLSTYQDMLLKLHRTKERGGML